MIIALILTLLVSKNYALIAVDGQRSYVRESSRSVNLLENSVRRSDRNSDKSSRSSQLLQYGRPGFENLSPNCKKWTGWAAKNYNSSTKYYTENLLACVYQTMNAPTSTLAHACDDCSQMYLDDCKSMGDANFCQLDFRVLKDARTPNEVSHEFMMYQCIPFACGTLPDHMAIKSGLDQEFTGMFATEGDYEFDSFEWKNCVDAVPSSAGVTGCDSTLSSSCSISLVQEALEIKQRRDIYHSFAAEAQRRRYQNAIERITTVFATKAANPLQNACLENDGLFCLFSTQAMVESDTDMDLLINITMFECVPRPCENPRDQYIQEVKMVSMIEDYISKKLEFVETYSLCSEAPQKFLLSDACYNMEQSMREVEDGSGQPTNLSDVEDAYRTSMFACFSEGLNTPDKDVFMDCKQNTEEYLTVCLEEKGTMCDVTVQFEENIGTGVGMQTFEFIFYQCLASGCNNPHDLRTKAWMNAYTFEALFGPEDNKVKFNWACGDKSQLENPRSGMNPILKAFLICLLVIAAVAAIIGAAILFWKRNQVMLRETSQQTYSTRRTLLGDMASTDQIQVAVEETDTSQPTNSSKTRYMRLSDDGDENVGEKVQDALDSSGL